MLLDVAWCSKKNLKRCFHEFCWIVWMVWFHSFCGSGNAGILQDWNFRYSDDIWLVVEPTPLKNGSSSLGIIIPNIWNKTNHQPVFHGFPMVCTEKWTFRPPSLVILNVPAKQGALLDRFQGASSSWVAVKQWGGIGNFSWSDEDLPSDND